SAAAAMRFWVPQRSRVTRDISAGARCGLRSSQEYISSARLDAMVAYQPCRKSFARIPATVVIEGYISGPSGSRRYMRPRGGSALREGVVMDPHGGGRRRSIDEHGTPRRARPGRHAAGTRREGTADHIAALPVSRLRAEDDLLGDAPRTTGRAQVPLLELGGGAVVAVDQHRQRSERSEERRVGKEGRWGGRAAERRER